jgi:hypothetical protein
MCASFLLACSCAADSRPAPTVSPLGFSFIQLAKKSKSSALGKVLKQRVGMAGAAAAEDNDIRVARVEPASPAAVAGIQVGDRIIDINGMGLLLISALTRSQPPVSAAVVVERAGERVLLMFEPVESARFSAGYSEYDESLVGAIGLPICDVRPSSLAADLLGSAVNRDRAYVVELGGQPIPGLELDSAGQIVDKAASFRRALQDGTNGPIAFTILSQAGSGNTGRTAGWAAVRVTFSTWTGGLATRQPLNVPYLGGKVERKDLSPASMLEKARQLAEADPTASLRQLDELGGLFSHCKEAAEGKKLGHQVVDGVLRKAVEEENAGELAPAKQAFLFALDKADGEEQTNRAQQGLKRIVAREQAIAEQQRAAAEQQARERDARLRAIAERQARERDARRKAEAEEATRAAERAKEAYAQAQADRLKALSDLCRHALDERKYTEALDTFAQILQGAPDRAGSSAIFQRIRSEVPLNAYRSHQEAEFYSAFVSLSPNSVEDGMTGQLVDWHGVVMTQTIDNWYIVSVGSDQYFAVRGNSSMPRLAQGRTVRMVGVTAGRQTIRTVDGPALRLAVLKPERID